MAQFNNIKLTNAGLDMLAQAQTGKVLTFTAVRVGDGYIGDGDIRTLTALVSPVEADISIADNKVTGTGQTRLTARLRSGNTAFYLREIGIYAKVTGGTEALYAYASAGDNADYIPAAGGATNVIQDLNLFTVIGNAQNVSAVITAEIGVGREEFEEKINLLASEKQDNITGAAESITNNKLTAARAVVTDNKGNIAVSTITTTELSMLDNVEGNIQSQLNRKITLAENTYSEFLEEADGDTLFDIDIANMGDETAIYKRITRKTYNAWKDLASYNTNFALVKENYQNDGIVAAENTIQTILNDYLCFNKSRSFTILFSAKVPHSTDTIDLFSFGGTRKISIQKRGAYGIRAITYDSSNAQCYYPSTTDQYVTPNSYDEYHHYALVFDVFLGNVYWYQDGQQITKDTISNNNDFIKVDGGPSVVLLNGGGGLQYFKIVQRALTLSEIRDIYNMRSSINYGADGVLSYDNVIRKLYKKIEQLQRSIKWLNNSKEIYEFPSFAFESDDFSQGTDSNGNEYLHANVTRTSIYSYASINFLVGLYNVNEVIINLDIICENTDDYHTDCDCYIKPSLIDVIVFDVESDFIIPKCTWYESTSRKYIDGKMRKVQHLTLRSKGYSQTNNYEKIKFDFNIDHSSEYNDGANDCNTYIRISNLTIEPTYL